MARLTPLFSSNRAVREYTGHYYLPAALAYRERADNNGAVGADMVGRRHALEQNWSAVRFGEVKLETDGEQHIFELQVYLDGLEPEAVRVALYAEGIGDGAPVCMEMQCVRQLVGATNGYVYRASVPLARPATDYTARLTAHGAGMAVPLEDTHILWQR
ncbi:MAG: hypothetical protein ACOH2K_16540 [Burkholderiaceae bacterium]